MAYKMKMKKKNTLKGNQTKLDANKDGKISKEDFAMLKNKKKQKVIAWLYLDTLLENGRGEQKNINGLLVLYSLHLY
mgnify:CR=1 FL=1